MSGVRTGLENFSHRDVAKASALGSGGFVQTLVIAKMGGEAFAVLRYMTFLLLVTLTFVYFMAMCFCLGYGYGGDGTSETRTAGWVMLAFFFVTLIFSFLTPWVFMPNQRKFARQALGIRQTPEGR